MTLTRIRIVGLTITSLVIIVGIAAAMMSSGTTAAADAKDDRLKLLLTDKVRILEEYHESAQILYKRGKGSFETVSHAQLILRQGQLEICDSDKDRIAVLMKSLEVANQLKELAKTRMQNAQANNLEVLGAELNCINVQIELERVQSK